MLPSSPTNIHQLESSLKSCSCEGLCMYVCMQAYRSISKCVAAICDAVPSEIFGTVDQFISDIKVSVWLLSSLFCLSCAFLNKE